MATAVCSGSLPNPKVAAIVSTAGPALSDLKVVEVR